MTQKLGNAEAQALTPRLLIKLDVLIRSPSGSPSKGKGNPQVNKPNQSNSLFWLKFPLRIWKTSVLSSWDGAWLTPNSLKTASRNWSHLWMEPSKNKLRKNWTALYRCLKRNYILTDDQNLILWNRHCTLTSNAIVSKETKYCKSISFFSTQILKHQNMFGLYFLHNYTWCELVNNGH